MHSYTTLAVLALAVSTASPAFSAPVMESKPQARVDIDERSIIPSGLTSDLGSLAKVPALAAALDDIPTFVKHYFHGNSTRRALSDDEKRDPGLGGSFDGLRNKSETDSGIGKVVRSGIIGGVDSAGATSAVGGPLDHVRREPAFDLKGIAKTPVGVVTSLDASDGVKEPLGSDNTGNTRREPSPFSLDEIALSVEGLIATALGISVRRGAVERREDLSDVINALRLLSRQFDELD